MVYIWAYHMIFLFTLDFCLVSMDVRPLQNMIATQDISILGIHSIVAIMFQRCYHLQFATNIDILNHKL